MSDLHYPDLHIQGFRGIEDLSIPQLGRVTLITGKNNTGKSSILEALRLHTHNASPHIVYDILAFREEYIRRANRRIDERERLSDPDGVFHVSALFHGFPLLSENFEPISISTNGKTSPMELTIRIGWFVEEVDEEGIVRLSELKNAHSMEPEDVVALVAETEAKKNIHRLEVLRRYTRRGQIPPSRLSDRPRMPCLLVSPYSAEGTGNLEQLWDDIALTDNEQDVVEALRIIYPGISAVSMVGGEPSSEGRIAIVRADRITRPVPLRSFGDGMNRLFALALSLVNARGGVLLIDEFENGLHHSVQLAVWQMIFKFAQSLDVQVFATTHSQDAVEAFQEAAAESPEAGVLLRLNRRRGDIISTVFVESELAIITRDKIEVR